jgi:pimeloyl-ACP methyl ester carboxylesterase
VDALCDQVATHVSAHSLESVPILGYSLGGYVALRLAASRPGLVASVMTVATKLAWSPDISAKMARQFDADAIRAKVPQLAVAFAAMHGADRWAPLLGATRALMDDLGAHPRLTAETYAAITRPVRLCVGDRDTTVSVDETLCAARAIPNAELEVLPRTVHALERMDLERLSSSAVEFFGAGA